MKQFCGVVGFLISGLFCPSFLVAQSASSEALLQQMEQASRSLNYEFSYINVSRLGIESLRYRHAVVNRQVYAQLLQMDGPRREIVQRGNAISYFEAGAEPFTLPGDHIVDALPAVVYSNFSHLLNDYAFVRMGRTRIADRLCEVIRIVARDGTRYSYVVWLDSNTGLPLRVDLLDKDGETLEQYRVIGFDVNDNVRDRMKVLESASLPPPLTPPESEKVDFSWMPSWLPAGMKEVGRSRRLLPSVNKAVESRYYSDGLFSFSVNVNPLDKNNGDTRLLRTGRRTIQIVTRNETEITVVGELPPATARRIADNIKLGS